MNEPWGRIVPWRRIRRAHFGFSLLVLLLLLAVLIPLFWPDVEALGALLVVIGGLVQLLLSAGPPLPDPRELAMEERPADRLTPREVQFLRDRMDREVNSAVDLAMLMSFACVILGGGLVFIGVALT